MKIENKPLFALRAATLITVFLFFTWLFYPIVLGRHFGFNILQIIEKYDLWAIFKTIKEPFFFKILFQDALLSVITIVVIDLLLLKSKRPNLHGKARFAKRSELRPFLKAEKGLIIGKYKGQLLRFPGQQFVALAAPTRSGKGVSVVIPNLLDCTDSMVVMDIPKGEGFTITSRYRKEVLGQEIYLFAPFKKGSSKYNPLDYVDFSRNLEDVQLNAIASSLYKEGPNDSFFTLQARELFVGMALFVHDLVQMGRLDEPFSLATVLSCSSVVNGYPFEDYYSDIKERLSPGASFRIDRYLATAKETKTSIKSSFDIGLALFGSKIVAENTSSSDFNLNDIRKRKMTIYIHLSLEEILQAKPLLNLFFSQILTENTKALPEQDPSLKHPCVFLLDEFSSIGTVEILKKGSAFIAGYNLRMVTAFQSISQISENPPEGYGKEGAKTLLENHACQILFAPKDLNDAKEFSERLGYMDVESSSISRNSRTVHRNVSDQIQRRALMLPQELRELPVNEEIILIESKAPIRCEKAFYYDTPEILSRLRKVSPSLRKVASPTHTDFIRVFQKGETAISRRQLGRSPH